MKYNPVTKRFEKEEPADEKKKSTKKGKALFTPVDQKGREVDPKDLKEGKKYGLKEGR